MKDILDNAQVQDTLDLGKQKRNYVIVFDIDGTLCTQRSFYEDIKEVKHFHPECLIIPYSHKELGAYDHVFIPYLDVLMNYLIQLGFRIVFFSSAIEDRNHKVITTLLEKTLGKEHYQLLKAQGQFDIFSKQHMRPGNRTLGETGNNIKDLTQVIKPNESILDAILIEDQSSYAANDQEPCISVIDVERWGLAYGNESEEAFPKNGTYYILGIFKTYFDHKEYSALPLRKGIEKIVLQRDAEEVVWTKESPFVRAMIYLGLSEVKKSYPEAIFYGYELLERYAKD